MSRPLSGVRPDVPAAPAPFAQRAVLLERDDELRVFEARLSALRGRNHGGGACILVHGEAGAGKTALVKAVQQHAGDDVEWLWGSCEPLLAAPALGPLIDLLDRLPPSLARAVRSGHAAPDVLAGMLALLRDRAWPAVLVIDDVQWADSATLDLLRYVGRRIETTQALLVLCWRDEVLAPDHPLRLLLGGLPARRTERLLLPPLTPQAVAALAHDAGRSSEGLHAATLGNPFFVTEWLAGDGRGLPEAVRDAVLGRASRLSATARVALDLVSVGPAGLEAGVIDAVIDSADAALGECTAAGLLQREAGVLRFRHELARQSVHSACDPARIATLHAAVFDALSRRGAQTARLVHHAEHAGLTDAVIRLAPLAAREAARAGAHRQAATHCALALSHAGALDPSQQAGLYVAHMKACMSAHRLDEALHSCRKALALHRHMAQPLAEGASLREMARIEWFRGAIPEGKVHAAAAIEVLARLSAPRELALAHATMAHLHLHDAAPDAALDWGRQALAWFESQHDEGGVCYALSIVAAAELIRDDQPEFWQRLERSLEIALRSDLPESVGRIHAVLASMALVHRRFERLHAVCEAGIAYCDARDRDLDSARLRIRRASGWIELGDWPAARDELRRVRATPELSLLEDEQSLHLLALLDLRSGDHAVA
ncbi:MAG: ATP-binding protein, partial [Caldimonas sp.]